MVNSTDSTLDAAPTPAHNTRAILALSLLAGSWIGILFYESTQPSAKFLGLIPQLDKAAHLGAFCILGLLICSLSLHLRPKPRIPVFSIPLVAVTLCGVLEECVQMFVPGRVASIFDVLADMFGGILAILLINRIRNMRKVWYFLKQA